MKSTQNVYLVCTEVLVNMVLPLCFWGCGKHNTMPDVGEGSFYMLACSVANAWQEALLFWIRVVQ